eukprot:superscaffoldBa00001041_g8651
MDELKLKNTELYDSANRFYKDNLKTVAIWKEIASAIGTSVAAATLWSHERGSSNGRQAEILEMASIPSPGPAVKRRSLKRILNNMKANSRDCVGDSEYKQTCRVCTIVCCLHRNSSCHD